MKYNNYNCDLSTNAFGYFFVYVITCPLTYQIADSKFNAVNILFLVFCASAFTFIINKTLKEKAESIICVFDMCKKDNEKYEKKLSELTDAILKKKPYDVLYKIVSKEGAN